MALPKIHDLNRFVKLNVWPLDLGFLPIHPCVRGYAPPTKKWQNYWSNGNSKCLKAFVNFLKEEWGSWSKSKLSVTSDESNFLHFKCRIIQVFQKWQSFYNLYENFARNHEKNWICVYSKCLVPMIKHIKLPFNNQVRVDTFSNASQLKLQRSICFAIYLEFPLAFKD